MTIDLKRDEEDPHRIARDGEVIRVRMQMADHEPLTFADVQGEIAPQVFDAFGNRAGNRPGMVFASKLAPIALTADNRARVEATLVTHDAMVSDAWRRPGQSSPAQVSDTETAYQQYEADLGSAWMKRGAR